MASSGSSGAAKVPPSAVNRVAAEDRELARQGSLVDGESIKIVIHHADNDMSKYLVVESFIKVYLQCYLILARREIFIASFAPEARYLLTITSTVILVLRASLTDPRAKVLLRRMLDATKIRDIMFH